ncbi:MAG TPA: response regulator transcription factor [Flavisolibacter sp.]|nr:response regulator transcription factor [Flavisolibacter sp.]
MRTAPIKIILADDHEIFRDGFRVMIKKQPSVQLLGEASNGEELISLTRELRPDVVVTDIKMPKLDGIEATKRLSSELPHVGIIALSMFDEENLIVDMLEAGAKGYLLKNAHKDEIIEAIKTVNNDQTYYCNDTSAKLAQLIARSKFRPSSRIAKPEFSEKEFAVIRYICQEMSNKEIAYHLNLSIRTIEGYRDRIQEKIGAKNTAGIVVYAIKNNIYVVD